MDATRLGIDASRLGSVDIRLTGDFSSKIDATRFGIDASLEVMLVHGLASWTCLLAKHLLDVCVFASTL